jgi:hypothetical protein
MSRARADRWTAAGALLLAALAMPVPALGQVVLDAYLGPVASPGSIREQVATIAKTPPGARDEGLLLNLLPATAAIEFARMVAAGGGLAAELADLDARRLNKMVAGTPGTSGTSLLSKAVAPAVLAAAVEYGGILQQTTGTTTTLRGNLLGTARLLFGSEQFPICPIDGTCGQVSRRLRAISGTVAFENLKKPTTTAPIDSGGTITTAQLLGDDYRVAAWGARLDLNSKDDLQAPELTRKWIEVHQKLQSDPSVKLLSNAGVQVVSQFVNLPSYADWRNATLRLLQEAPDERAMHLVLQKQLNQLVGDMSESDLQFGTALAALVRANGQFIEARDAMLRAMHTNRFSVEYTNNRPFAQPSTSNIRAVYSHQPTAGPTIFTVNLAATLYDSKPDVADASQFRDVQLAGQVDRRLGEFGTLGNGILTLAGYYQWMKEDAVVKLGPGGIPPNSSIELSDTAATVLGTKGHIGVAQLRFSLAVSRVVRVPLSVTFATRRELIKEEDVRGQIGVTLDLDQALR